MKNTEEQMIEFSKRLSPLGFYQLKISKFPTWVNATIQNGIEVRPNDIKTFRLNMGERDYEADVESITKKAVDIFYQDKEEPEPMKPIESVGSMDKPVDKPNMLPEVKESIGVLPEFFTEALMTKWKSLPGIKRLLDVQRTPEHQIYEVEIGRENGKPVMASYVKGNYMITEANYVFLFDWNYDIAEVSISETGVSVRGVFVGNLDGKVIRKTSVGYQERNKRMDAQQATKAALTDAIKKALSYMGFNRDVYGGEI